MWRVHDALGSSYTSWCTKSRQSLPFHRKQCSKSALFWCSFVCSRVLVHDRKQCYLLEASTIPETQPNFSSEFCQYTALLTHREAAKLSWYGDLCGFMTIQLPCRHNNVNILLLYQGHSMKSTVLSNLELVSGRRILQSSLLLEQQLSVLSLQ